MPLPTKGILQAQHFFKPPFYISYACVHSLASMREVRGQPGVSSFLASQGTRD